MWCGIIRCILGAAVQRSSCSSSNMAEAVETPEEAESENWSLLAELPGVTEEDYEFGEQSDCRLQHRYGNNIPCPKNLYVFNIAHAIFEAYCEAVLPQFHVFLVHGFQCQGQFPCRWAVTYKHNERNKKYSKKQITLDVIHNFQSCQPPNVQVLKPGVRIRSSQFHGKSFEVLYGVHCSCTPRTDVAGQAFDNVWELTEN